MKRSLITIALLAVSVSGFAQDVNTLINQDDVTRIIKTLSADDMQGRATFTPGIEKAATFIENEYTEIGLKPLAGNTGYRQNFSMIHTSPISTLVSINNTPLSAENICIAAGKSFNWSNDNDVVVAKIDTQKSFQSAYRQYMTSGKKTLLFISPKFKSNYKRLHDYINRGSTAFSEINNPQQIVLILGTVDSVKSFEVKYESKSEQLPLFNVAGIIPGKSKPDEYVVFSGHYDHLGILKAMKGDSIANGADDDASGTTAVIALAKYHKKLDNNARTLIFVAFTAEEIGEFGSQYFATQVNPDKVVAMFNIEMIGKASKFGKNSAFITGFDRSNFGTILQQNLQGTVFKFHPDPYPEQDLFYRSDNASLAEKGVPAHTISTDQIDIDKLYHTVKDEFSTLDVSNITSTIRAIALSSRSIVSGKDTPTRVPKLEK
ncbi:M20/M25/M40 family metallo-hydrolase [Mucilaginibacter sp. SP1R1]|uniref:M20/M25/M40 family metallo-hydrolase n=1 Tax=Mucilaginibacter sp. SP1R1 TaxID=2723091 RepID=UPI00160AA323|nr:M20/M25/M40 family metallo-hydrolase [Mucilaginibacter sp. SP1R1]MBB6152468.1 hypothetical protein [Mucilaginibacter sp. SP1R1]